MGGRLRKQLRTLFLRRLRIVNIHLRTSVFFFNNTPATEIYTLSLHDALPICTRRPWRRARPAGSSPPTPSSGWNRSEEHTSELQSHSDLVCRLLLEKKKNKQ